MIDKYKDEYGVQPENFIFRINRCLTQSSVIWPIEKPYFKMISLV